MQPSRAEKRPPSSGLKDRDHTARTEHKKASAAGRKEVETAHAHALNVKGQREEVENDAAPHHKLGESEIPSQPAQERRKSP